MNKLVRDYIPDIIESNGEKAIYRVLEDEEYKDSLKKKLEEEYIELRDAESPREVIEECADLLEVLFALAKSVGYSEEDLIKERTLKREKRGGFDKRIYLERVD